MSAVMERQQDTHVAEIGGTGMVAMIERMALNPSVDADKVMKLMEMAERINARKAEDEFNQAMATAQAAMGRVVNDRHNQQTRSNYASYPAIDKMARPIYTENGFALSFGTGEGAPEACVRVTCLVSHRGGHSRNYHIDMPADGKGAKGGDVMTKTHATGSAMQYGMRYLLKAIFNIATSDKADDDGNGAGGAPFKGLTDGQKDTIDSKLAELGGDKKKRLAQLLKWLKVNSLDEIPETSYKGVIETIEAQIRKGGQ